MLHLPQRRQHTALGSRTTSPPATPGNSLHGGGAFKPADATDEQEAADPAASLPFAPPKAMTKNLSIGSFLYDWGHQRVSPQSTPGNSLHGGSSFAPAAGGGQ